MRKTAIALLLAGSLVTFTACSNSSPTVEAETPSQAGPSPMETLSRPHGTWSLSDGLPEGLPEYVPLPKDRWIEAKSTEVDDTGGMIELWVEAHEVDAIISGLETAGWTFDEPSGSGGERVYAAYIADMSESLYFGFRPEEHNRDAQLTVTWTPGLGDES